MRGCAQDGAYDKGFDDGYAEARRLVLEKNDLDGALLCLYRVRPASGSALRQWTDFVAALLYRKGDYQGSMDVLTGFSAARPDDRCAKRSIHMLKRWLGPRPSESGDS